MNNKEKMIRRFNKVKELGFIKSNRANNTGIGKTFEDYVGVIENNANKPDLFGYEIKSHREATSSFVTLFTKSPDFPKGANRYLRDSYGRPYDDNPNLKKLHVSMFANEFRSFGKSLSFKLIDKKKDKVLLIGIYDQKTKRLIDSSVGYKYETIEKILNRKLKALFYVGADRKYSGGVEYFRFNKAEIYSIPSLEKFLKLVKAGKIMYDIRIGSYQSGKSIGKAHDHGSGFRISEKNLHLLFKTKEVIS